jgi:septum site-determining protein MinC
MRALLATMTDVMTLETDSRDVDSPSVLEIKAASFSLPVIHLTRVAMEEISRELQLKVEQAPELFRNAPVVIDLSGLEDPDATLNFPRLVGLLRGLGMLPVGLRGGTEQQQEAARAMELVLMRDFIRHHRRERATDKVVGEVGGPSVTPGTTEAQGSVLVGHPVRSGQKIYAAGGDLTVIAAVNSGAELMADGNIHIYGPLRGRVFAGIKGDTRARIFCQDLQAELVAVAGHYRVSENIPAKLKKARVQIYLHQEVLRIEPF